MRTHHDFIEVDILRARCGSSQTYEGRDEECGTHLDCDRSALRSGCGKRWT